MDKIFYLTGVCVWGIAAILLLCFFIAWVWDLLIALHKKNWFSYYIQRHKYTTNHLVRIYPYASKSLKKWIIKFRLRNIKKIKT